MPLRGAVWVVAINVIYNVCLYSTILSYRPHYIHRLPRSSYSLATTRATPVHHLP